MIVNTTNSPLATSGTTSSTAAKSSSSSTSSSSSSSSSTASSASAAASIDYNSFLKLLVAELQNQDPTNPADPTQYMSQIASFSAVGQTVQTNQKLDTMMTTSALAQAESAIGRTVTSADGSTSGVISSVSIGSSGAVTANLVGGKTLTLGSGVTLS